MLVRGQGLGTLAPDCTGAACPKAQWLNGPSLLRAEMVVQTCQQALAVKPEAVFLDNRVQSLNSLGKFHSKPQGEAEVVVYCKA